MKFTMPHCFMSIAVITVVVIGTLPVNVDAEKDLTEWEKTMAEYYRNKGGKTGGKTGTKAGAKIGAKIGAKSGCHFCCCNDKALYKCDFKTLLENCPEKESFSLTGKGLTGTLPAALQNLTNLETLNLEMNQLTGSIEVVGKLTKLQEIRLHDNKFTGSVKALGKLKPRILYLNDNQFNGTLDALDVDNVDSLHIENNNFTGSLQALSNLSRHAEIILKDSGTNKFAPPVPPVLIERVPDQLYDLGLVCKWLGGAELPYLVDPNALDACGSTEAFFLAVGQSSTLRCPQKRFPFISSPIANAKSFVIVKEGNCAEAGYSIIAKIDECKQASDVLIRQGLIVNVSEKVNREKEKLTRLPYCGYSKVKDGMRHLTFNEFNHMSTDTCSEDEPCVCRNDPKNVSVSCVRRKGEALWEPTIDKFKCTASGVCKLPPPELPPPEKTSKATKTAEGRNEKIKKMKAAMLLERGVNLSTCTTLQDGAYCDDYDCTKYKSMIRNPARNKILCKFETWQEPEQTYCIFCPPGQYKVNMTHCNNCSKGTYLVSGPNKDVLECENCLRLVPDGECQDWLYGVIISVPILLLALIYPTIQFVKLIIRALTAWKPQSKADAALAKQFVVPKKSAEMAPVVAALKIQEATFIEKGWTAEQMATIKQLCDRVVLYLSKRVRESYDSQQIRVMRCCQNMDALHDFKTLYDATMKNIRSKEREGFNHYTAAALRMKAKSIIQQCPLNPNRLIDLYNSGRAAYDHFHAFIAKAAKASATAYVYKTHDNTRQPGMKGIYRVLEKGVFKYDNESTEELDLGHVRDLVRGGIIDLTMQGLGDIAQYILASDEVTVCRVKDRFNDPSPAGWTDLMVNFYLNDDPDKHVCEVQLIHFKMLSQRTTQEGHAGYNIYRAASELLSIKDGSVSRPRTRTKDTIPLSRSMTKQFPNINSVRVVPATRVTDRDSKEYHGHRFNTM